MKLLLSFEGSRSRLVVLRTQAGFVWNRLIAVQPRARLHRRILQLARQVLIVNRVRGVWQAVQIAAVPLSWESFSLAIHCLAERCWLALIYFRSSQPAQVVFWNEHGLDVIRVGLADGVALHELQTLIQEVGCVPVHRLRAFLETQVVLVVERVLHNWVGSCAELSICQDGCLVERLSSGEQTVAVRLSLVIDLVQQLAIRSDFNSSLFFEAHVLQISVRSHSYWLCRPASLKHSRLLLL